MTTRERLTSVLGAKAALRLVREFGGKCVRVPSCSPGARQLRNQRVIEALACNCGSQKHHSNKAVARRFSLSVRQIIKIGKNPERPDGNEGNCNG